MIYNSLYFLSGILPFGLIDSPLMDVYFVSARQSDLLTSPAKLGREFGKKNAELLALRLQSLFVADNLEELRHAPGHLHELTGDRKGTFAFRLQGPLRLVFAPQEPEIASRADGSLLWSAIRAVVILEVVDYHD